MSDSVTIRVTVRCNGAYPSRKGNVCSRHWEHSFEAFDCLLGPCRAFRDFVAASIDYQDPDDIRELLEFVLKNRNRVVEALGGWRIVSRRVLRKKKIDIMMRSAVASKVKQ